MKKVITCVLAFLSVLSNSSFAVDATAIFKCTASDNRGLFTSDAATNQVKKVFSSSPDHAHFSPDGKKIAVSSGGKLIIIYNDGSGQETALSSFSGGLFNWTTNGILWIPGDSKLHKYDPATGKQTTTSFELGKLGGSCGGGWGGTDFYCSGDGLRAWLPASYSKDGCDKYGRGTHPFIKFSSDYSSWDVAWNKDWGHGNNMSLCGEYMFMNEFGSHLRPKTWQFDGSSVKNIGMTEVPHPDGWKGINALIPRCANDKLIMGANLEDDSERNFKFIAYKWKENPSSHLCEFKPPSTTSSNLEDDIRYLEFWWGALPNPHDNTPFITIDKSELVFTVAPETTPAAQTITVTNAGSATLGKVEVSVAPASAWLAVTVEGSGGNTQTITNTIDIAQLTADESNATVTVSGGGASNQRQYTVTVYKGSALPAPTALSAQATGDSAIDVLLKWTDNSSDEEGFIIERMKEGGSWIEVTKPAANATSYTDTKLDYGAFTYRVRAYKGSTQSGNSNEADVLVKGIPWIVTYNPKEGDVILAGTKLIIKWSENLIDNVKVEFTSDGLTWETITQTGGILAGSQQWRNYSWTVPDMETTEARVKVVEYATGLAEGVSGKFTITKDPNGVGRQNQSVFIRCRAGVRISCSGSIITIENTAGSPAQCRLLALSGALITQKNLGGPARADINLEGISRGAYIVQIEGVHALRQPVIIGK